MVLLTAFEKSLIYQSFHFDERANESSIGGCSGRPSRLVIVPLRSIIDIHHFAALAKMASILVEFSGEYFDFHHLSASCLREMML